MISMQSPAVAKSFPRGIQQRYEIEKGTADGEIEDWMREPGVLDDWNDRRPILDM